MTPEKLRLTKCLIESFLNFSLGCTSMKSYIRGGDMWNARCFTTGRDFKLKFKNS